MEVFERRTLEDFMERIRQRLDRQEELLNALQGDRQATRSTVNDLTDNLLDNQDLCLMLHVSKRSLQRYRSLGLLPYRLLQRKPYYRREDVETFIEMYAKEVRNENKGTRKPRFQV